MLFPITELVCSIRIFSTYQEVGCVLKAMQENIKDMKQESYHADGTKEDTEDANNPQDILSN